MLPTITGFAETATTYSYSTTSSTEASAGMSAVIIVLLLVWLVVAIVSIVALWKIFQKAGKPGWASILPVYNSWVLFELVGYPGWWALLTLIPIVNIFPAIMAIITQFKLAKLFGKSDVFAVMNVLFPVVTLPMLAFGSATFQGRGGPAAAAAPVMNGQPGANPVYQPAAPVYAEPVVAPQTFAPQTPGENVSPVPPQPPVTPPTNLVQ